MLIERFGVTFTANRTGLKLRITKNREWTEKNGVKTIILMDENNVKVIIFFVEVKNNYRQVKGKLARIYIL